MSPFAFQRYCVLWPLLPSTSPPHCFPQPQTLWQVGGFPSSLAEPWLHLYSLIPNNSVQTFLLTRNALQFLLHLLRSYPTSPASRKTPYLPRSLCWPLSTDSPFPSLTTNHTHSHCMPSGENNPFILIFILMLYLLKWSVNRDLNKRPSESSTVQNMRKQRMLSEKNNKSIDSLSY